MKQLRLKPAPHVHPSKGLGVGSHVIWCGVPGVIAGIYQGMAELHFPSIPLAVAQVPLQLLKPLDKTV